MTHLIVEKFKLCHKKLTSAVKDCPTRQYPKKERKIRKEDMRKGFVRNLVKS